jgi:hypothetical protein
MREFKLIILIHKSAKEKATFKCQFFYADFVCKSFLDFCLRENDGGGRE